MISKTCETYATFSVKRYRADTARFCSRSCMATWIGSLPQNKGPKPWLLGNKHAAGNISNRGRKRTKPAWNKGLKGIHLSPESEFKPGHRSGPPVPIGEIRIRFRKRDGSKRAYIKVAEPNVWRLNAHVVWESAKGPIPKGKGIHHADRNTLNDAIDNLECLTKAEHIKEHKQELWEARWPLSACG